MSLSLRSPEFGGKVRDAKRTVDEDPGLRADIRIDWWILRLARDPESPLRWTCKSVRVLAEELRRQVKTQSVIKPWPSCFTRWITAYPRPNQKKLEGSQHADRNPAGLNHINRKAQRY